jgi:ferrous iron transport protein B
MMNERKISARKNILATANSLRWEVGENFHDGWKTFIRMPQKSLKKPSRLSEKPKFTFDKTLDKLVTSKWTGFPVMFLMLAVVFWITIEGANIPSAMIASFLIDDIHPLLKNIAASINIPLWLGGVLIDGAYLAMAWVISVMLPPMAIFFPLFTLLEDFGYLPRVAFNMDSLYKKAGAHGKQALTMAMGFGCNAAGIIATR